LFCRVWSSYLPGERSCEKGMAKSCWRLQLWHEKMIDGCAFRLGLNVYWGFCSRGIESQLSAQTNCRSGIPTIFRKSPGSKMSQRVQKSSGADVSTCAVFCLSLHQQKISPLNLIVAREAVIVTEIDGFTKCHRRDLSRVRIKALACLSLMLCHPWKWS
jgi:hypothetical protein